MKVWLTILNIALFALACDSQKDLQREELPSETFVEPIAPVPETVLMASEEDTLVVTQRSVIFFTPTVKELQALPLDQTAITGIRQAVGDFAYYASLISDSLDRRGIPVHFTDKPHFRISSGSEYFEIDRNESGSLMGLVMYNGESSPEVLPGMQTHLSLWAAISDYFFQPESPALPLLDYFEEVRPQSLHVFSSHSEILNQTGQRLDPGYHFKLGPGLAARAKKYRMSVFAYYKFLLPDSLTAVVCRVPSRYDESSIKLYIWDQEKELITAEIELAENIWNDHWIMVKDSWVTTGGSDGVVEIIQRKKEARMENGKREETDSLYRWRWAGQGFKPMSTRGLSLRDYPLKDWASYQESEPPPPPTEFSFVNEDFVWLPLNTGDLTWENIVLQLPKPYTIVKEPIVNQYKKKQVDTVITISQPNLELKFYRSPDKNMVIGGVVSDSALEFKKGLKVGISKHGFTSLFKELDTHPDLPDLIKISSKHHDRIFSYYFKNDTLVRIELTNFIH